MNPGLLKAEEEGGNNLLKERRRPRRGEQTLAGMEGSVMVRLKSRVPKLLLPFFELLPSFYNSGN